MGFIKRIKSLKPLVQLVLIANVDMDVQAEYADDVCKQNVLNRDFIASQFKDVRSKNDFEKWNVTSVGNCAYVALNCTDKNISALCMLLLKEFKEYINKKGEETPFD